MYSKIFDAQIQPALLFASEIWGTGRVETVEKVHLFAPKRFLRLSNRNSVIVYGERGRYPLAVKLQDTQHKILAETPETESRSAAFWGLPMSSESGGKGQGIFGEVWYNQGVGDENMFLRTFSQRLKDCFEQSWHDKLESSDSFFEYKLMKQKFGMEEYMYERTFVRRITKI